MIIYIGVEKAFNEVQHAFMIIVRELLGLMSQWAYLKTIKDIVNVILKKLRACTLKSEMR